MNNEINEVNKNTVGSWRSDTAPPWDLQTFKDNDLKLKLMQLPLCWEGLFH